MELDRRRTGVGVFLALVAREAVGAVGVGVDPAASFYVAGAGDGVATCGCRWRWKWKWRGGFWVDWRHWVGGWS
jgi:hypothetical protein